MDGSEVVVRLGRREQAAGAAVPALGRERTEEGAGGSGGDGVDGASALKRARVAEGDSNPGWHGSITLATAPGF